jgi:hypothetical protein
VTYPAKTPQTYRERASVCERLASHAHHASSREIMIYLAMRWRALADEDEAGKGTHEPRRRSHYPSQNEGDAP